jgi:hypothetical protein
MKGFLIRFWKKLSSRTHQISGDENCLQQLQIFTFVVWRRHAIDSKRVWYKFREKREGAEDDKLA